MEVKIALAGNPNSGKTTMFNALTGSNQRVGNWPGVTVEKKEGTLKGNKDVVIQDLPGIYSLSPYTLEEVVARNYLVSEKPDAIINIVDGTNIERNLYLTTQLLELGIPTVVAVNMIDVVRKNGDAIDIKKLAAALGCEVMVTSALKGEGSVEVAKRAAELAAAHQPGEHPQRLRAAAWSTPSPTSRRASRARWTRASCAGTPSSSLSATRRSRGAQARRRAHEAHRAAHRRLRARDGRRQREHHHQPALRLHSPRGRLRGQKEEQRAQDDALRPA